MGRFIRITKEDGKTTWFVGDPNSDIKEQCDERFASIPISYHVMTKEEALQELFNFYRESPTYPDTMLMYWDWFYRCYSGNIDENDRWYEEDGCLWTPLEGHLYKDINEQYDNNQEQKN